MHRARIRFYPLATVFLLLLSAGAARVDAQAAKPATTVFEGARLITGDGSAPIENSAFVVVGNEFTQVGRRGELRAPAGAAHVDLSGKTVMPALVDLHGHIGYQNIIKGTMSKAFYTRQNLIDHLQRLAYSGVSEIVSIADLEDRSDLHGGRTNWGDVPLQVRAEVIPNAALFKTAGVGIAWPGSGPQGDPSRVDVPYPVSTVEEARKAVDDYVRMKPEFVKIWVDDRGGTKKTLTPPLYRAIIEEAHKYNVPVAAHNVTLADAKELIRAGDEGWLHVPVRGGDAVDNEVISLVKQRVANNDRPNMWMTPALITAWMDTQGGGKRPAWLDDPLLQALYSPEQIEEDWGRPLAKRTPKEVETAQQDIQAAGQQCDETEGGRHSRGERNRYRAEPILDRLLQPPGSGKYGGNGFDAVRGDCCRHERLSENRASECGHGGNGKERRFHRAGRKSARIHWQYATNRTRSICEDRKWTALR